MRKCGRSRCPSHAAARPARPAGRSGRISRSPPRSPSRRRRRRPGAPRRPRPLARRARPGARALRTSVSPLRPAPAARAISGQRLRVEPLADAGLTRKTTAPGRAALLGVTVSSASSVIGRRPPAAPRRRYGRSRPRPPRRRPSAGIPPAPCAAPPSVKSTAASISTARMPRSDQRGARPGPGRRRRRWRRSGRRARVSRACLAAWTAPWTSAQSAVGAWGSPPVYVQRRPVGRLAESATIRSPSARSGCSPPQVPTRTSLFTPSWISSSNTMAADGQPIPVAWTERASPVRPRVAEHAALAVPLRRSVEERLGDVSALGAGRRGGGRRRRSRRAPRGCGSARRDLNSWRHGPPRADGRGPSRYLEFCAGDPIERVFLEDVARRGLGKFSALAEGARLVALCHRAPTSCPPGRATAGFADVAARSRPRMIVGEEGAVTGLWDAIRHRLPAPVDDRPGQPVYVTARRPPAGGSGPAPGGGRRPRRSCPPAEPPTWRRSASMRSCAGPGDVRWRTQGAGRGRPELGLDRGRPHPLQGGGLCVDRRAVQLQQVWVERDLRGRGYGTRALADLVRLLLETRRRSASSCGRRTSRRSACTSASAWGERSRTAR